jgi:alkaline phosphatase D
VLFAQHTLSRGVMKMTAQMPPVGPADSRVVRLQLRRGDGWVVVAEAPIDPLSRTATFRVPGWDASRDVPYRLAYALDGREHHFAGTVRRDPVDKRQLVVAGLSCMVDLGFPNTDVARGVGYHDPDVLLFMGDQLYEGTGGYGVQRNANVELATLDYLRKWYMAGWSFGELMRDRPSVFLTDDHDVYHGNIWGEGGADAPTMADHPEGGYFMPPEWINMVQRTQTSHHPDPVDPTPVKQGIEVYYGEMLYGRASFALLEDRKWKTGPEGIVPPNPGRPDHIKDPTFDTRLLDVPEAELLGERQLRFLDEWGADWRGADFKVAVSQTIFAQIPNIHGEEEEWLAADLDSNGWPQTPRDEALRSLRKTGAFHLCGDQHIPMLVRYGIEDWDDAGYTFCVPAIATGYPRAFRPLQPGQNRAPGAPEHTGQFLDGFGNRVTVHAVANPAAEPRQPPLERLADKASGYGIVRLDRQARTITMECWPLLSDPARGDGEQFAGWPMTVAAQDNLGEAARASLPPLRIEGLDNPVVQVINEKDGEVVCTLRPGSTRCAPRVFKEGTYSVRIGDDQGWRETIRGLNATRSGHQAEVRVALGTPVPGDSSS